MQRAGDKTGPIRVPGWLPFAMAAALVAAELAAHLWMMAEPVAGAVSTGLRIQDYVYYYPALRMFGNGFYSPVAFPTVAPGAASAAYFMLPLNLPFGVLGVVQRLLGLGEFTALALASAGGLAAYLGAVWLFLRRFFPRARRAAFVLFCAGGGIGGLLYLAVTGIGLQGPPWDAFLFRFARYDLLEGPYLRPDLFGPRPYYAWPLAMGFLALTLAGSVPRSARWGLFAAGATLLLFVAGTVNVRLAPLFLGAVALQQALTPGPAARRWTVAAGAGLACATAVALNLSVILVQPVLFDTVTVQLRRSVWLSGLLVATFWLWPGLLVAAWGVRGLPRPWAALASACIGYLAAFAAGYAAYWVYHGGWTPPDFSAPLLVSDWALSGALAGAAAGWLLARPRPLTRVRRRRTWALLWAAGILAVGVSAFGQGWFLRLMPERAMCLLGVPLTLAAVHGFSVIARRMPRLGRGLYRAAVASGLCSVAVSALLVQGPWAWNDRPPPLQFLDTEFMPATNAGLLAPLPARAFVMAPYSVVSEALIAQTRAGVALSLATLDFSNVRFEYAAEYVDTFFAESTAPAARAALLRELGVTHVLVPSAATMHIDPGVREQLADDERLALVEAQCGGLLYRVVDAESGD